MVLLDMWNEGGPDRLLSVILSTVGLAMIAFAVWGMLWVVDFIGLEAKPGQAWVVAKEYREPYTTTSVMLIGKIVIPAVIGHPEEYNITLENDEGRDTAAFPTDVYERVKVGRVYPVTYTIGRLSGNMYIKSIGVL